MMQCPHGCMSPCSTCESSAAARELRALRIVADAARVVANPAVAGPLQSEIAALRRALEAVPKRCTPRPMMLVGRESERR